MARAWLRAGAAKARARRGKAALATAAIAARLSQAGACCAGKLVLRATGASLALSVGANLAKRLAARQAVAWSRHRLPNPTSVSRPLRGLSRQIASLFLAFRPGLWSRSSASSRHFCILPHAPRKACEQLFASSRVPTRIEASPHPLSSNSRCDPVE